MPICTSDYVALASGTLHSSANNTFVAIHDTGCPDLTAACGYAVKYIGSASD